MQLALVRLAIRPVPTSRHQEGWPTALSRLGWGGVIIKGGGNKDGVIIRGGGVIKGKIIKG